MIGHLTVGHRQIADVTHNNVVDKCRALSDIHYRIIRHKEVVIYKCRTVSDLNEEVAEIVVIDVFCHASALSLPVKPSAEGAMVDIVIFDYNVNSCVELDAAYFVGEKFVLGGDVIYFVVLNS